MALFLGARALKVIRKETCENRVSSQKCGIEWCIPSDACKLIHKSVASVTKLVRPLVEREQ